MTEPEGEKPPRQHRNRTLKAGTILRGIKDSEVKCTIRNMHDGGAELRVHLTSNVPSEFLLYVAIDRLCYRCVLRWRDGERLGVMFLGTVQKPSWHYG